MRNREDESWMEPGLSGSQDSSDRDDFESLSEWFKSSEKSRRAQEEAAARRTVPGYLWEGAKGVPRGVAGMAAGALQGASALGNHLRTEFREGAGLPDDGRIASDRPLYQAGLSLIDAANRLAPLNPDYEGSMPVQIGEAGGSLAGFAVPGGIAGGIARRSVLNRGASALNTAAQAKALADRANTAARVAQFGTAAPLAGSAGAAETYQRATEFARLNPDLGLSERDILKLLPMGVSGGLAQIATLGPIFRRIPSPARKRSMAYLARRMAEAGITEFTVENAGAVIQNLAERTYNPDHPVWDEVPDRGEPAAYAAALLQLLLFPTLPSGRRGGSGKSSDPPAGRPGADTGPRDGGPEIDDGRPDGVELGDLYGSDPDADLADLAEALSYINAPATMTDPVRGQSMQATLSPQPAGAMAGQPGLASVAPDGAQARPGQELAPGRTGIEAELAGMDDAALDAMLDQAEGPDLSPGEAEGWSEAAPPDAMLDQAEGQVRRGRDEKYGIDVEMEQTGDGFVIRTSDENQQDIVLSTGAGGFYRGTLILNQDGEWTKPQDTVQAGADTDPARLPFKPVDAEQRARVLALIADLEFAREVGQDVTPYESALANEIAGRAPEPAAVSAEYDTAGVVDGQPQQEDPQASTAPAATPAPAAAAPAGLITRTDGRPFETARQAAVAGRSRKLEGYVPIEVEGGWALAKTAPESETRPTRSEQARAKIEELRQIDETKDDLLTAIRKLGGLDTALENDWADRFKHVPRIPGLPNVERPGRGHSLDHLAERLHELGYLQNNDATELAERLAQAETGARLLSIRADLDALEGERDQADQQRSEFAVPVREDRDAILSAYAEHIASLPAEGETAARTEALQSLITVAEQIDADAVEGILERASIQGAPEADIVRQLVEIIQGGSSAAQQPVEQVTAGATGETGQGGAASPGRPGARPQAEAPAAQPDAPAPQEEVTSPGIVTLGGPTDRPSTPPALDLTSPEGQASPQPPAPSAAPETDLFGEVPTREQEAFDAEQEIGDRLSGGRGPVPAPESAGDLFDPGREKQTDLTDPPAKIQSELSEVDTNPTEAQKEAGNYKKAHIRVHGLDITIENPKGSIRSGVDADGNEWSVVMPAHYGYFKRTEGADGDQVDVFVGDELESRKVWVVDAIDQDTGTFDEHKVLLAFDTRAAAVAAYKGSYQPGWKVGTVTETDIDAFKEWLKDDAAQKRPFAPAQSEAPEHQNLGASEQDLASIAQQPSQPRSEGESGGAQATTTDGISPEAFRAKLRRDRKFKAAHDALDKPDPTSPAALGMLEGWLDAEAGRDLNPERVTRPEQGMRAAGFNPVDFYRSGYFSQRQGEPSVLRALDPVRPEAPTPEATPEPPLRIEDYTEKSIIVRGQTRENIDRIKSALPGRRPLWNKRAKGWIFPKAREADVRRALSDLLGDAETAQDGSGSSSETAQQRRRRLAKSINKAVTAENNEGYTFMDTGVTVTLDANFDRDQKFTDVEIEVTTHRSRQVGRARETKETTSRILYGEIKEEISAEARSLIDEFIENEQAEMRKLQEQGAKPVRDTSQDEPSGAYQEAESRAELLELLVENGRARVGQDRYDILRARTGPDTFYVRKTGPGGRTTELGPDAPARWTRQQAVERALREAALSDSPAIEAQLADMDDAALDKMLDEAIATTGAVDNSKPQGERAKTYEDEAGRKRPRKQTTAPERTDIENPDALDRTASEIAKSLGYNVSSAGQNAIKGLTELFGGKGKLNSGLTFDPDTYAKAKPHFEAMWSDAKAAGRDLMEFAQIVTEQFGAGVRPYLRRFLIEKRDGEQVGSEVKRLADAFAEFFSSPDNQFSSITQARAFAADTLGRKVEAGTADAKLVDEAIELGVVQAAREIVRASRRRGPETTYERLVDLYGRQPNLSTRTSTSVAEQAYSTPIPLAYLAAQAANITGESRVYEPSAGNGALLVTANPTNVAANELNPARADNLEATLDGASITRNDAADWRPRGTFDVVIANPPFGAVRQEDGTNRRFEVNDQYETGEIDHAISMKALEAMADDGSAVLIVGSVAKTARSEDARSDAYNSKAKREFYLTLYGEYNVVDHFTVAGELYTKQGAGWPVDVIVIRGRGKSSLTVPAANPPRVYDSWAALSEVLNAQNAESAQAPVRSPDRGRVERDEPGRARAGDGRDRPGSRAPRPDRFGVDAATGERAVVRNGLVDGESSDARPDRARDDAAADSRPRPPERARPDPVAENERQVAYQPGSGANPMGTLVPVNMQTAIQQSLEALRAKVGDIDAYVADRLGYERDALSNYFGAEQIDAIGLALDNMEKGAGFIIGDQTGIGKGRVVASIIRYAIKSGRTPIFVTEKPNLYGDMYRDLTDIGIKQMLGREPQILMTNAAQRIPLDEEGRVTLKTPEARKHNAALMEMAGENSIGEHDVVFTTYSQMQTNKGNITPRMKFLEAIAQGGIVVFDESHNAGGSTQQAVRGKQDTEINRATFARNLARAAHGVFYSSATYAKRPDVMDLYATTDMRLAVSDISNLSEAIAKGGVPMQQVVASMLAEAGQYVRRERSFDGIAYNSPSVSVSRQTYNSYSNALMMIQRFSETYTEAATKALDKRLKAEGKAVSHDGSTGGAGASSTNFTSVMHNLIDQMLLAVKAGPAADRAIEALKNGEKPVITVANTMGSFIADYTENMSINNGDRLDLTFNSLLNRYLERTRWITVRRPFMKKGEKGDKVYLTDQDLGDSGVRAFNTIRESIDALDLSTMPVSPIDYIRSKLQKAGYKVGEITGRNVMLDYRQDGAYFVTRPGREASIAGRRQAIAGFNSGKIDAMIINQAGSTGLSLHASEKFKDQRKRRMIIAQPEKNIDTHMQMLGRVHRTGQVVTPEYDQLVADVPAEKRPAAVLAKKMASLNANTTASRDSALTAKDVPDFMNEYGDSVAVRVMADMPEINRMLGQPIEASADGDRVPDAMRKVTGRIPLLPLEQQEMVYELLESEYAALLAQKEAAGESALEAKTFDLDAETLDSRQVVAPQGAGSPFAAGVNVEIVNVKRLGKPYPTAKVLEQVAESLGTEQELSPDNMREVRQLGAAHGRELINQAMQEFAAYRREILDDLASEESIKATSKRLEGLSDRFKSIVRSAPVGTQVRLSSEIQSQYGVVTKIERTGKAKNPVALGSWKVTVALLDASRQIVMPMSQLYTKENVPSLPGLSTMVIEPATEAIEGVPVIKAFDQMQMSTREDRTIITGNLLAGFDHVGGRGTIINFTDKEGRVRQGIMMARNYRYEKEQAERPVDFRTAAQVLAFIGRGHNSLSSDGAVTVSISGDNVRIDVVSSKSRGGKYFLDQGILRALQKDFVKVGDSMRAEVPLAEAPAVIDELKRAGAGFRAVRNLAEAREVAGAVGGEGGPASFSRGADTLGRASDGAARLSTPEVSRAIANVVLSWADGPTVEVIDSWRELPPHLRAQVEAEAAYDAAGLYDPDTESVYLMSDQIRSVTHARRTLAHEAVGHYGMERLLGEDYAGVVEKVKHMSSTDDRMAAIAERVRQQYPGASSTLVAQETIARAAEQGVEHPLMTRIYAAIRRFLRSIGFNLPFNTTDLNAMIARAERMLRTGRGGARAAAGADGGRYSFAGERARTSDLYTLGLAKQQIAAGVDAEIVRLDTGWFQGPDGRWRFEINDADASLVNLDMEGGSARRATTLDRVLNHPALFAAYPGLRSMLVQIEVSPKNRSDKGSYSPGWSGDSETFGKEPEIQVSARTEQAALSTLLHEIQHGIQHIEGFAEGGSPTMFAQQMQTRSYKGVNDLAYFVEQVTGQSINFEPSSLANVDATEFVEGMADMVSRSQSNRVIPDALLAELNEMGYEIEAGAEVGTALDILGDAARADIEAGQEGPSPDLQYRRLAGEVEARNVQRRAGMTDADRRATAPSRTQDVADSDVIVMFNGSIMESAPRPANSAAGEATTLSEPMTVYHGTRAGNQFSTFDPGRAGSGVGGGPFDQGAQFYATRSRRAAEWFAKRAEERAQLADRKHPDLKPGSVMELTLPAGSRILRVDSMPRMGQGESIIAQARADGFDAVQFPDQGFNTVEGDPDVASMLNEEGLPETLVLLSPLTHGSALFQRSGATAATYEARIDDLFNGGRASPQGVRVLDRSDILEVLGYENLPVHLAEGKVVSGKFNHGLTAQHWKNIPEWLDNPAAVFESDTVPGRLVFIAPEALGDQPIVMILEPNANAGRLEAHLLVNAYDKTGGRMPVSRWVDDGLLRYLDKKKGPALGTITGLRLPGMVHQRQGHNTKVFTERDLVKHRRQNYGEALFSRGIPPDMDGADAMARQAKGQRAFGIGQPVDRMFRAIFDITGQVDAAGRLKSGVKLDRAVERALKESKFKEDGVFDWMNPMIETVRAGIIDRFGLSEAYKQRDAQTQAAKAQVIALGESFVKMLAENKVGAKEARVLQAILTNEPLDGVDGVDVESLRKIAVPIRKAIDDLGKELVALGFLDAETYQRHLGKYLHRAYLKHEASLEGLPKWFNETMRRHRRKIYGDTLRARGLKEDVTTERLLRDAPRDWWGRKLKKGEADKSLKDSEWIILDRLAPAGEGTQTAPGVEPGGPARRRTLQRVFWPADVPLPARFETWEKRGKWRVTGTQGAKLRLRRDFTKAERERMGEILDARYNIIKTFQLMAHDIAYGKFYRDIALNPEWSTDTLGPGDISANASQARRMATFVGVDWVKVPSEKIGDTGVAKWGDLAGRYVRPEIWRDLNEIDRMQSPGTWRAILTQWKLMKTARSPVVHMNNVMSNLILMDLIDVRMSDLVRGIAEFRSKGEMYQEARENNAFGASFVEQELRRNLTDPLLDGLIKEARSTRDDVAGRTKFLSKMGLMLWESAKKTDRWMVDMYQTEDTVFRMATYMRHRSLGATPAEAAMLAREQFLNYDIRAPWVNAARESLLPFISYTYRAVPAIATAIAHRPWKIVKYATVAYLANILAYELAPGDEDEERRTMRESQQGMTWASIPFTDIGAHRMIRLPLKDQHDNPLFLDVFRWIPAGDVFDTNQGQAGLPAWLQFGGPLQIGFELFLNRSAFTGRDIVDRQTDTWSEAASKRLDYLWKAWMPSAAYVPGSWHYDKLMSALRGERDILERPYSIPAAAASGIGIKVQPHDVQLGYYFRGSEIQRTMRALQSQARQVTMDERRGIGTPASRERELARIRRKMERLQDDWNRLQGLE